MQVSLGVIVIFVTFSHGFPTDEGRVAELLGNSNEYYEKKFNESIQCLRRHLYKGVPIYEIPPCDPLAFDDTVRLYLDNNVILQTNLKLKNLVIKGLLDFDVVSLTISSNLSLYVNYHFKNVKITSLHEGHINLLGLMGILTDGELDLEVSDINITTVTKYNIEPALIDDYKMTIKVGSVNLDMTGLASDEGFSKIMSELISVVAPRFINIFHKEVTKEISPIMQEKLNSRIGHLPFLEFLALVAVV